MKTEKIESYSGYHPSEQFDSNANSSDSDPDTYVASPKNELPKRNKRKNFEPRCSNVSYFDNEFYNNDLANLNEYKDNNNIRRRKTLSTRKIVVDSRFSPIDLSKPNDSGSNSDSDDNFQNSENDDGHENSNSETESKIPQSFSILNLSKPHVADFSQNSTPVLSQDQVREMRQYAMSTMRELLGIYGLTSEVAESISRQLPVASFNSGKLILFNFNISSNVDLLKHDMNYNNFLLLLY